MSPPLVWALVLNWCAEEDTAACVASLEAQAYPALGILCIDNASPDGSGTRLAARFPQHGHLQTGANLGYAGGNALGTAQALRHGADYVLVINDDATLQPGALRALVDALEADPRAAMAAPTVLHHDAPDRVWWAGGHVITHKAIGVADGFGGPAPARSAPPRAVDFVSGCALLLRAEALQRDGGLDPAFTAYLEDVDLSLRWRRRGWRLLHVPAAVATHKVPWPAPAPSPYAITLRDRNRRRIAAQHFSAASRLRFHVWYWPSRVLRAVGYLLQGDLARAAAVLRGALG